MEGAVETHDLLPTGPEPRQLDGTFVRFGAAVGKEGPPRLGIRRTTCKAFTEPDKVVIVEIRVTHVEKTVRLLFDRFDNSRMRVTRGRDRDAGAEVQEQIPVDIFHTRAIALLDDQGIVLRVVLRHDALVTFDDGTGSWARQRCDQSRIDFGHARPSEWVTNRVA